MNRWTLVALLVGVGFGYLSAGVLRAPERERAARPVAPAGDEPGAPERRAPQQSVLADARPDVVEPRREEPVETDEGNGLLRVEFAGLPDAYPSIEIHGTDILGHDVSEEHYIKSGSCVEVEWPEGTIRITWTDGGAMHRCEARVRIRAGLATEVDAADPRYRVAEPASLAVLTVRVPAAGGGWREGVEMVLGGDESIGVQTVFETTNRDGYARFRVKPGTYLLELGMLRQSLDLGAGERRVLEPAHGARGDVLVEPACPGTYSLMGDLTGEMGDERDGRAVLAFLDEGDYDLVYQYQGGPFGTPFRPSGRALGRVRVVPGQTTVFRHEGQPGAVDVQADVSQVAGADRVAWSVRVGRGVPVPLRAGERGLVARVERLEPGTYPVVIRADGMECYRATAIVGFDSTTRVAVTVLR